MRNKQPQRDHKSPTPPKLVVIQSEEDLDDSDVEHLTAARPTDPRMNNKFAKLYPKDEQLAGDEI